MKEPLHRFPGVFPSPKIMNINRLGLILTLILSAGVTYAQTHKLAHPQTHWVDAKKLTMLALERETTSNQLAAYVANTLIHSKQPDRHQWAARLLGLGLSLHPQNPRAQRINEGLALGMTLPAIESENAPEVLSRLLYHRAKQLEKGSLEDKTMAAFMIATSAYMAPYFEAAVYDYEKRRLQDGALNWRPVTGQTNLNPES